MRNHRLAFSGVTLSLVLLFSEPVIDAAQSLILNETVEVQGKKVGMQMFTLQCPLFLHKEGKWGTMDEVYTFHLIDKRALPTGVEPRVQANGYYSFGENKWKHFLSIDENQIIIGNKWTSPLLYGYVLSAGKRTEYPCAGIMTSIDRNTLSLVVTADRNPNRVVEGWPSKGQTHICTSDFPSGQQSMGKQCQLLPYKAPPERIGF